jgi:hypothetical protein
MDTEKKCNMRREERDGGEEGWHAEKEGIPFITSLIWLY